MTSERKVQFKPSPEFDMWIIWLLGVCNPRYKSAVDMVRNGGNGIRVEYDSDEDL